MLLSESKERGNRFRLSLKIGFPFLIIIFVFFILRYDSLSNDDIIFLSILAIIYIYYIFYLIYSGFKSTLIDPITRTFNYPTILNIMDEFKENSKNNKFAVMISLSNIFDLNDRYGLKYGDKILNNFIKELDNFLNKNGYKEIPIGRYGGGFFLFFITCKEREIQHNLRIFINDVKNENILGNEIKSKFSILPIDYDENNENIITQLLEFLKDTNENIPLIKPDVFDKIVYRGMKKNNFLFKYQTISKVDVNENGIFEVLTKLKTNDYGDLSYGQVISVVNRNGYEVDFDEAIIENFIKDISSYLESDKKFMIKISAVSIRSQRFKNFIEHLVLDGKINAKNIIIELNEKKAYEEIKRFKEILDEYKKLGFSICLDQFGGNNASLEYIKYLPIDYVNFDIEYTKNLNDERYSKIFISFVELLKNIHVKSIVKFIDNEENYEFVKKIGVDFIQGHYISKPKKLEDL